MDVDKNLSLVTKIQEDVSFNFTGFCHRSILNRLLKCNSSLYKNVGIRPPPVKGRYHSGHIHTHTGTHI